MSKQRLSQTRDSMHAPSHVLWAGAALLFLTLAACSERDQSPPPAQKQTPSASAPLKPSINVASMQKVSSKLTTAGMATRYDAYFDGQQLKAIVEERQAPSQSAQGEYLYMGARLMQYVGGPLPDVAGHDAETIEMKLDLQGRLLSVRDREDPARAIEPAQVDALRARAELLRSHALTQRSISAHQQAEEGHG